MARINGCVTTVNTKETVRTTTQGHAVHLSTQRPCLHSRYKCIAASTAHWPVDRLTSPLTATLCEDNWRMMSPIEHQIGNRPGENIEAIAWVATHWFSTVWRQKRQVSLSLYPKRETWELPCSHIGNQYMFIITCGMWGCFNVGVRMGRLGSIRCMCVVSVWCCLYNPC